jgi:N-acetylneuraminate lyase
VLGEFISAVAAEVPETHVYFYHIPSFTGVDFPMTALLEYAAAVIPNFAGIKYTHYDLMDFHKCLVFDGGRYDIFWGRDETLLSALVLGAKGAVGSTYNYAAPLYRKIISFCTKGDIEQARRLQLKAVDMVSVLGRYGGLGAGKAFMKYAGIDCGKFRIPVVSVSDQEYTRFREEVGALDMAELLSQTPPI